MDAQTLTADLVRFESTSSLTNVPIIDYCESLLKRRGFEIERLDYTDEKGIRKSNIVGKKGAGTGGFAYFGHTDVVPADPWLYDDHGPFDPTVKNGTLIGRGSCDMKGSVACAIAAADRFSKEELKHPIYITLTADEEVGYHGARNVAERSELFREMVAGNTNGIIGEPTELEVVYAHKGTYGIVATSKGKAAHSSTKEGVNANLAMIPFLAEMKTIHDETLTDREWLNDEFDPPWISWNIGVNDYTYAVNITPPQSVCTVYFRPMPGQDPDKLLARAEEAAKRCGVEFQMRSRGKPLYVDPNSPFVQEVLRLTGKDKARTVAYGTDGAMLTDLANMLVLGPGSIKQAHTHDEFIALDQLEQGTDLYATLIKHWCC